MSDSISIARPYAKAIFEQASTEKAWALWSEYLHLLAQVMKNNSAFEFITNPASTVEQHTDLFLSVCSEKKQQSPSLTKLISLLATKKRLLLLPEIQGLYEIYRAEQEKTLDVLVISFSMPNSAQQEQMAASLSERLQRKVSLIIQVDPSLLGGAIIQAGDLVIDGSIRGKLNKLGTDLAA